MQNQSSDHTGQGTALRVCLKRPHVVRSIANQQKPEWVERSLRIQNHYRYRRAAISSLKQPYDCEGVANGCRPAYPEDRRWNDEGPTDG